MAIQQTLQFGVVLAIAVQLGLAATTSAGYIGFNGVVDAENLFVARGHTAHLECDLETFWLLGSIPPPVSSNTGISGTLEAQWLFNDQLLSKDDGRWKIYGNGTLVVPKIGKRLSAGGNGSSGEGIYQCLAELPRYGAVLAKTINLRIAYLKKFLRQPDDVQARQDQPIIVPCSINSLPKAGVQWERDGITLPQNKRYVPLPSGSLLINNVHSSDKGSYRCKVVNTILKKTITSKAGYLTVLEADQNEDTMLPTGILPLDVQSNITAVVGDDVTLYCVTNGTRQLNLRWSNENDIVISNTSIFTLTNITRKQSGRYSCSILNPGGSLKKVYYINVQQPPGFNSTPSSGVHVLARNIRLNCTAAGWPVPKIKWFKNGRVFDVQSHIRARQSDWGLLIRSPTASDAGIYQCMAYNQAGIAWSGASVRLNASTSAPRKPWDIECLPYEEDNVCLRWRADANVMAHTIIAHKTGSGMEREPLRDFLGKNESYKLVGNLHANAQYMFLIRTYIKAASTEFSNVTCSTGVRGVRNVTVQLNPNAEKSVTLNWQPKSSDFNPCNESINYYQVQWRQLTSDGVNSIDVTGFEADITGLQLGANYEFRVKSANSSAPSDIITYSMPVSSLGIKLAKQGDDNRLDSVYNATSVGVMVPLQLYARVLTANSINVSWSDDNPQGTSYSLCYIQQDLKKSCELNGKLIEGFKSDTKSILLVGLRPRTDYEIRIQAHFGEQSSLYSHSLLVSSPPDVPSEVQGLEYKILTRTSACVKWEPPSHSNGRIAKYSIRHTSNLSLPVEFWMASSIFMPRSNDGCWDYDADEIVVSTVLHDLDPDLSYFVNVVAVNDAGSGSATETLSINTKYPFSGGFETREDGDSSLANQTDVYYKQGIGVAIGVGIAFLGIFVCFGAFVAYKYFKKRLTSQRFTPNGGPYSSATTRAKQMNGQQCHNSHELQQLVETNGNGHLLMCPTTFLDTKGGAEYPNRISSNNMNGHAMNLRITENPQYYNQTKKTGLNGVDREYEADSNSNLQKICPITKSICQNPDVYTSSNGKLKTSKVMKQNGVEASAMFNSTRTTVLLDDSISSTSSSQPTLQPNG